MFSFLRGGLWDHRRQGLPEGFIFFKAKVTKGSPVDLHRGRCSTKGIFS